MKSKIRNKTVKNKKIAKKTAKISKKSDIKKPEKVDILPVPKKAKRKKKSIKLKAIGMEMDKIYTIINDCQIKKVEQYLIVDPDDFPVIDNILKDCQMSFVKREKPDGYHYVIQPPPVVETPDESFIFTDELLDEIVDDDEENSCF